MAMSNLLLDALLERFGDRSLRVGEPPDPIATFPAKHPDIGDVRVSGLWNHASSVGSVMGATVAVGAIIVDYSFQNFDTHLEQRERAERVTKDVVRFLQELFTDRLLFWRSADGGNAGWRERGDAGYSEPLVLDDRVYHRYLWSGPRSTWQATPAILARGRICDEREHFLMSQRLNAAGPEGFPESEQELARKLVAEYERDNSV
jgi:hypothetical protein